MSIINEALKKAEKEKKNSPHSQIFLSDTMGNLKREAQRFALRKYLFWTSTGVFCLVGGVWAIININMFRTPKDIFKENAPANITAAQGKNSWIPPSVNAPETPAIFRLSGIIFDKGKSLAIINQEVLSEGASINGAKITEICSDCVKLSFKDEEIVLNIE
ncbi:MAG: hypothetical protein V1662_06490 [Candidatus Omnitrophota bacterium]